MEYYGEKKKVTYKLVKDGKAVYIGTTNDPYRRNDEHSDSGKKYDYMEITSPKVSAREAERREARNLDSYRQATGRRPRYNKTDDGKFHY